MNYLKDLENILLEVKSISFIFENEVVFLSAKNYKTFFYKVYSSQKIKSKYENNDKLIGYEINYKKHDLNERQGRFSIPIFNNGKLEYKKMLNSFFNYHFVFSNNMVNGKISNSVMDFTFNVFFIKSELFFYNFISFHNKKIDNFVKLKLFTDKTSLSRIETHFEVLFPFESGVTIDNLLYFLYLKNVSIKILKNLKKIYFVNNLKNIGKAQFFNFGKSDYFYLGGFKDSQLNENIKVKSENFVKMYFNGNELKNYEQLYPFIEKQKGKFIIKKIINSKSFKYFNNLKLKIFIGDIYPDLFDDKTINFEKRNNLLPQLNLSINKYGKYIDFFKQYNKEFSLSLQYDKNIQDFILKNNGIFVSENEYFENIIQKLIIKIDENFDLYKNPISIFLNLLNSTSKKYGNHDTFYHFVENDKWLFLIDYILENINEEVTFDFLVNEILPKYKSLKLLFDKIGKTSTNLLKKDILLKEFSNLIKYEKDECFKIINENLNFKIGKKIEKNIEKEIGVFQIFGHLYLDFLNDLISGKYNYNLYDYLYKKNNKQNIIINEKINFYFYKDENKNLLSINKAIKYLTGIRSQNIIGKGIKPGLLFKKIKNIKKENEKIPFIFEHGKKEHFYKYEMKIEKNNSINYLFCGNYSKCCMNYNSEKLTDYINNPGFSVINLYENGKVIGNSLIHFAYVNGQKTLIIDNIEINKNKINNKTSYIYKKGILFFFNKLKKKYNIKKMILGHGNDLKVKSNKIVFYTFFPIGNYKNNNGEKILKLNIPSLGKQDIKKISGIQKFKDDFYTDLDIQANFLLNEKFFFSKNKINKRNFLFPNFQI